MVQDADFHLEIGETFTGRSLPPARWQAQAFRLDLKEGDMSERCIRVRPGTDTNEQESAMPLSALDALPRLHEEATT